MKKSILVLGAFLATSLTTINAQYVIGSQRSINISSDTDSAGGNEGISLLARNSVMASFTPDNISHKIRTFFEAPTIFKGTAHFDGIPFFNKAAKFGQEVDFKNGYKVTSGSVDFNIGSFTSKSFASFIAHIDRNSNDPNVDTFKVLYGTAGTKILDVGISKTQLLSRNFESRNEEGFVVNVDINNNSVVDKFKVLYGNEKREVLSAGKDDVTISTKLVTKNDISTNNIKSKNIAAEDIVANKVTLRVGSFPDYVFADNYELMPLEAVASFIKKHQHLPNMKSEKEVVKEGIDLKELTLKLVEKVEELTLYTIQQQQLINELQAKPTVNKNQQ
ncbi:hypothetical protein DS884_01955 [Tenacibaculum sp. E3R01]|uniref:hypothetical protein n=1 Tax=Tenacibaculum sp. E3R01 TaxID=2267227 RepID=UPI000DE9BE6B|nr:hypothetical protein [Tenacibaculum sp. E3R01]RBW62386.1 hypothetical protein DS884_01955 [Tenacibaculum sp. E3R01]